MKEMNEKIVENPFKDDDNFDEGIPMQIRKERTTQAYKDNMDKDIETVENNDNSKQIFQKTKWRTIYVHYIVLIFMKEKILMKIWKMK